MAFDYESARKYFKSKGISSKKIALMMDNYSESLVSRYLNQREESPTFIYKLRKYFPDAPVDEWIINDINIASEQSEVYQVDVNKRLQFIIKELSEIQKILSQK